MTEPLVAFLLARLDEEQDAAQEAADEVTDLNEIFEVEESSWRRWSRPAATLSSIGPIAEFVNRQSPERALAEIKAKRLIVDDYLTAVRSQDDAAVSNLGWALLRLAFPYRGHEDYREEWQP